MNYTISPFELKSIHNALCDLGSLREEMEDVFSPALYRRLASAENAIRAAIATAREQADKEWDDKNTQFEAAREQHKLRAVWSMYEIDDLNDKHGYNEAKVVEYCGEKVEIKGNKWIDLFIAGSEAIAASGDSHHIYIEAFTYMGNGKLHMHTGS